MCCGRWGNYRRDRRTRGLPGRETGSSVGRRPPERILLRLRQRTRSRVAIVVASGLAIGEIVCRIGNLRPEVSRNRTDLGHLRKKRVRLPSLANAEHRHGHLTARGRAPAPPSPPHTCPWQASPTLVRRNWHNSTWLITQSETSANSRPNSCRSGFADVGTWPPEKWLVSRPAAGTQPATPHTI